MPKIAINYDNTQIYKLVHKDDLENENVYVGHTTNWAQRKRSHKSVCNNSKSKKYDFSLYQNIRDNGGWDEWSMIWLEDYPCGGQPEACARERYWIEHYESKLNSLIPGRNNKEYTQVHREKIKEYKKKYHKDHKEKISESNRHYRENNPEKVKEYNRTYREDNKESRYEKITCENCGMVNSKNSIAKHKRTIKCMNFTPQ